MHAVIENQVAMGDELPVGRAVDRLMGEGLDRHQAIHAVGSVLAGHLHDALKDTGSKTSLEGAYNAEVERLTVESWRRSFEEDGDEGEEG